MIIKKISLLFVLFAFFVSCKSETKKSDESKTEIETQTPNKGEETLASNNFEKELIDLRKLDRQFTQNFGVKKFGIKKKNDSLFAFVFALPENTVNDTVKKYSIGIKAFSEALEKPIKITYTPEIVERSKNKYLILPKKFKKIRYFDSLDVYIFERKNWKKSGRLGGFKVKDILFE